MLSKGKQLCFNLRWILSYLTMTEADRMANAPHIAYIFTTSRNVHKIEDLLWRLLNV